jgi:hypothetical protein
MSGIVSAVMAATLISFVDDEFFHRSKLGTIWGTVYFQIDDERFFPDRGWTDLSAAFVRGWLRGLLDLKGASEKLRIPFFDGPLAVEISRNTDGSIGLDFIDIDNKEIKLTTTADFEELVRNALIVSNTILRGCRERGWSNADTEALEELVKAGCWALPN